MSQHRIAWLGISLGVLIFASSSQLQGQPSSIVLTNARVQGADFIFEILAPDLSGCVVQAASSHGCCWEDLPGPVQSPFVVRVDRAECFFRVRCGDSFSANAAGYLEHILPVGFSMVGNPFYAGRDAVAELFPNPPPRTTLYTFDAKQQIWRNADVFEFGAWTQPEEKLGPGEGAMLETQYAFRWVLGGLVPTSANVAQLEGGLNLVCLPIKCAPRPDYIALGEWCTPGWNDTIYMWSPAQQCYVTRSYEFGAWSEEPVFRLGEAFWYDRDQSNPTALPPEAAINFNNYLVDLDDPFVGLDGARLEGTNWVAQLYASPTESGAFQPIGAPLPFLTGAGAGYLDTRAGAVRMIPFALPWTTVWVQARIWERSAGATYDEAVANGGVHGVTAPTSVYTGGVRPVGAPVPPSKVDFNLTSPPLDPCISPTHEIVFAGSRARFTGRLHETTYQWQKLQNSTNWVDISGATTDELVFDLALPQDSGTYRLLLNQYPCDPVKLDVLSLPQFSGLTQEPVSGAFSFGLALSAGFSYRIEASTDCTNWLYQITLPNFSGSERITDAEAGSFRQRFYRVIIAYP